MKDILDFPRTAGEGFSALGESILRTLAEKKQEVQGADIQNESA